MTDEQEKPNLPPLPTAEEIAIQQDKQNFLPQLNWWDAEIDDTFLNFAKPYTPPAWTLSHAGVQFAKLGDLHIVTGKAGHGKTAFMSQVMATILCGKFGRMAFEQAENIPKPKVLYVDTEQSEDDTIAIKNRVCMMAGIPYDRKNDQFFVMRLREVEEAKERWRKIVKAVDQIVPTVLFLDGMLDIVEDYNEQTECQPIIRQLMMTATKYNCSLWSVLHENPTTEKMVGSLGSIAQRKVTEIFIVRKHKLDKEKEKKPNRPPIYFSVEQLKARGRDVPDWDFQILPVDGWGRPEEIIDAQDLPHHDPREIQKWIEDNQDKIQWPASRMDIYGKILTPVGITDSNEQREIVDTAIRSRLLIEEPLEPGKKNHRLSINRQLIPF